MRFKFPSFFRNKPHYITTVAASSALLGTGTAAFLVTQSILESSDHKRAAPVTMPSQRVPAIVKRHGPAFIGLGDSITRGVGDLSKLPGYLALLQKSLNQYTQENWNFSDLSEPGAMPLDLQKQLEEGRFHAILRGDISFVCISMGSNVLLQLKEKNAEGEREEMESTINSLRASIEMVRSLNDVPIFLLGFYNPASTRLVDRNNAIVNRWNLALENLSHEFPNVIVIPTSDIFRNHEEALADDGIHPSHHGYHAIHTRLLQHILPFLYPGTGRGLSS